MANINLTKNDEITFPPEIASIIKETLIKYGLRIEEEEILEKIALTKNNIEVEEIFESAPDTQLAKIVREVGKNKISLENLENVIRERLNVSEETAKKIAKDFKEKILPLIPKKKARPSLPSILFGEELLSSRKKEEPPI